MNYSGHYILEYNSKEMKIMLWNYFGSKTEILILISHKIYKCVIQYLNQTLYFKINHIILWGCKIREAFKYAKSQSLNRKQM